MKCSQKKRILWIFKRNICHMCRVLQDHTIPSAIYTVMFISMEEINSEAIPDGIRLFCQPNIYICCEHIVLFLRNMFEFFGLSLFLEICATSKEVVLFYENGFVLLRFACGLN